MKVLSQSVCREPSCQASNSCLDAFEGVLVPLVGIEEVDEGIVEGYVLIDRELGEIPVGFQLGKQLVGPPAEQVDPAPLYQLEQALVVVDLLHSHACMTQNGDILPASPLAMEEAFQLIKAGQSG